MDGHGAIHVTVKYVPPITIFPPLPILIQVCTCLLTLWNPAVLPPLPRLPAAACSFGETWSAGTGKRQAVISSTRRSLPWNPCFANKEARSLRHRSGGAVQAGRTMLLLLLTSSPRAALVIPNSTWGRKGRDGWMAVPRQLGSRPRRQDTPPLSSPPSPTKIEKTTLSLMLHASPVTSRAGGSHPTPNLRYNPRPQELPVGVISIPLCPVSGCCFPGGGEGMRVWKDQMRHQLTSLLLHTQRMVKGESIM